MVILDPPALTKTKSEQEAAGRAYHFLNRAALRLVKPGGILVTSSCSRFFSEEDLAYVLRRASVQAGVTFNILKTVRQAPDHPLSVYFPESAYLKSFIGVVVE
jgi:23S rRNA (cytosine1962-C5)-methyltransferase